jgi:hypothetical protein
MFLCSQPGKKWPSEVIWLSIVARHHMSFPMSTNYRYMAGEDKALSPGHMQNVEKQ